MLLTACGQSVKMYMKMKKERKTLQMESEEFQIFELLKRISDAMEKNANSDLRSSDITASQLKLLFAVLSSECSRDNFREKGQLSLKELERRFGVAQSTAAGIIQRLEKKKLVESVSDKEDKRVKIVRITDGGRKVCKKAAELMSEGHKQALNGFSDDEKRVFVGLLRKMLSNLENN